MRTISRSILAARWVTLIALGCGLAATWGALSPKKLQILNRLKKYSSQQHTVYSDLPEQQTYEAILRMEVIVEAYSAWTKRFPGRLKEKLPFYLFAKRADYALVVGQKYKDSGGLYDQRRLYACLENGNWSIVQHEAFHQFSSQVMKGRLPVWIDEGLAMYFQHAIWAGDTLLTGYMPPGAIKRIKTSIRNKKLPSMQTLCNISRNNWNKKLSQENYDMAWGVVHYFLHANNGKLRGKLQDYLAELTDRVDPKLALNRLIGNDGSFLEKDWKTWWLALPDQPTRDLPIQAMVSGMTSILARAHRLSYRFRNYNEFRQAIDAGKLNRSPRDQFALWLPKSFCKQTTKYAKVFHNWKLISPIRDNPYIELKLADGRTVVGHFLFLEKDRPKITVTFKSPKTKRFGRGFSRKVSQR